MSSLRPIWNRSVGSPLILPACALPGLRGRPLAGAGYYDQSRPLQQQIVDLVEQPAQHLGVRQVQGIFRDNAHRLYHWVENRAVPADNNRAERELRPTVIARKVSFGSQSDAGAKTREVLMSVVHTLVKRLTDPEAHFKAVLDQLAADPTLTHLLQFVTQSGGNLLIPHKAMPPAMKS